MGIFSIPKRVSEVLWQQILCCGIVNTCFQSLKGFQRFCGVRRAIRRSKICIFQSLKGFQRFCGIGRYGTYRRMAAFSIPKRVSEVLWLAAMLLIDLLQKSSFQSLKGFQRFCGNHGQVLALYTCHFSIPKRVSEVLWRGCQTVLIAQWGMVRHLSPHGSLFNP